MPCTARIGIVPDLTKTWCWVLPPLARKTRCCAPLPSSLWRQAAWEQVDPQLRLQLVHTDHIPLQATLDLVQVGGQKGDGCRVCTQVKHSLPAVLRDAHRAAKFVQALWRWACRHIDTAIVPRPAPHLLFNALPNPTVQRWRLRHHVGHQKAVGHLTVRRLGVGRRFQMTAVVFDPRYEEADGEFRTTRLSARKSSVLLAPPDVSPPSSS